MKFSKYRKKRKPRRKNDIYLPCLGCSHVFGTPEWYENWRYNAVQRADNKNNAVYKTKRQ